MADLPFWISRSGHDPSAEVASVETRLAGRKVMRYMLENAEEDGPLFLFGPGITLPDRCMFDDDGNIVIDII